MPNYTFLDASGATQTAGSSIIGGVNYPIVKIPDAVPVTGSIVQAGTRISSISGIVDVNSILGTYLEDAQHSTGDRGFFILGVRNDTMASISSLDADYTPFVVGPAGEVLTANAPITKWVSGTASILGPAQPVQPVIPAQGSSIFTYITGVQVTNPSNASVMVVIQSGATTLGYAMATANATTPIYYSNALKSLTNTAISVSVLGGAIASVFVSAQGFISKT